ncbi:MAG: tetratricopeptide repeat protein [Chthoniobacterales bacterium]|nr:tetratricopeptide repeat protein [Chthoniobacterales bacterium]
MSGRAKKKRRMERKAIAGSSLTSAAEQQAAETIPAPAALGAISSRGPDWRSWLLAALLVTMTVLAYQQVWHAGYIWDDDKYVTENPLLSAPDGLQRIWFSRDSPSQYFPLVYTTFRLEHGIWGLNPAGYHWVNVLLHAGNALLVWRLLRRLAVPGAWLAAALFALHPVNVESVAWITERKNVLMGLFFLLTLLAFLRFDEEKSRRRWCYYAGALLLYALALFSKTTACTMPAALLLMLWCKRIPITAGRVASVAPFVILGLGMGLLTVWWERNIQGTQGELFAMGITERLLVASRAIWFYLSKLLWPAELAFSYPRWEISASDPRDYVPLLLLFGAAAAVYLARRFVGRGLETAAIYFVAMLSPMLGFIMLYTFRYTFVADHYQYLATVGPFAVAAALATAAAVRTSRRYALATRVFVAAALLGPLGFRTWQQCAIYHDEETLWRATIAVNPSSWMARNNLGIVELRRGAIDEAIAQFTAALEIDPAYAEAHYNLGNAFVRKGTVDQAIVHYQKALALNPKIAGAHLNLGRILMRGGRVSEAILHLRNAVVVAPQEAAAHEALGSALAGSNRPAEALEHLTTAATLAPSSVVVQNNLGNTLLDLGRAGEAVALFQKALQLEPGNAEANYNLANGLVALGRPEEALRHYRRAVELRPTYGAARNNHANTLVQLGRIEEAIVEYQGALAVRPDSSTTHKNLGLALQRAGRVDEAITHLQKARELESQTAR